MNVARVTNTAVLSPAFNAENTARANATQQPREAQTAAKQRPSEEFLKAAQTLREALGTVSQTYAQYHVDRESRRVQVQIIDQATGEVVREIPPEALLRFAKAWDDYVGTLFDKSS